MTARIKVGTAGVYVRKFGGRDICVGLAGTGDFVIESADIPDFLAAIETLTGRESKLVELEIEIERVKSFATRQEARIIAARNEAKRLKLAVDAACVRRDLWAKEESSMLTSPRDMLAIARADKALDNAIDQYRAAILDEPAGGGE